MTFRLVRVPINLSVLPIAVISRTGASAELCTKQPVAARSAARETGGEAVAGRRPARDVELRDRQVDRHVRSLRDDEDDPADFDDFDRDEPRLFLFGGRRQRW